MARTPSTMKQLGTPAPTFTLPDAVSGAAVSLETAKGKIATVIMFLCNHCPFVKHINPQLSLLAWEYQPKGIAFIGISSNDVEHYPEDSPANMKITAQEEQYSFPYLYDEDQSVAKAYDAACTPDFFVYDAALQLTYRGQLDASRPGNGIPVDGSDLRAALDCLLAGNPVSSDQRPSRGCNIKWKPSVS